MSDFLTNVTQYLPQFWAAFLVTLRLAIVSLIFATIVGIICGLINTSKSKNPILVILRAIVKIYIEIIRGTPMLVQILIIYFGISQVLRPFGFSWNKLGGIFTAGVVVLTINAGAYMAEIIRAGIEAVDKGQIEAARSLGLSYFQTMSKIVLPQAIRTMLPSIVNQFIISIKDTSLMSTVGLPELTNTGKTIAAVWTSQTMNLYCFMALYYLVICFVLSRISKFLEGRMTYGR